MGGLLAAASTRCFWGIPVQYPMFGGCCKVLLLQRKPPPRGGLAGLASGHSGAAPVVAPLRERTRTRRGVVGSGLQQARWVEGDAGVFGLGLG